MLKSDSEAHHEYKQNPSADGKGLPYLHLVRKGGNSATVSVHDSAEHQEEAGQDSSCNRVGGKRK